MRLRLTRGGLWIVTSDGRHVRCRFRVLALVAAPIAAVAVAVTWFAAHRAPGAVARDVRVALTNLVTSTPAPRDSALPTVELVAPDNTFLQLEEALAKGDPALGHAVGGNRPFLNALLVRDRVPVPCEIALLSARPGEVGDKPSLRVKFRKNDAFDGGRHIDLERPEDPLALDGFLYAELARGAGLLENGARHVRLFVNQKPFGVYLQSLPPNDTMSIAGRRPPGTFLLSDGEGEPWTEVRHWRTVDEAAAFPAALRELLLQLAQGVGTRPGPPPAELWDLLDLEQWARWAAVRAALGRVAFPSAQLALFFSAVHGRLEPIAWSGDGVRGPADAAVDGSGLLAVLASDPRFVRERDRYLAELLDGAASRARLEARIDELCKALGPDLAADVRLVEREPGGALAPVAVSEIDARGDDLRAWVARRDAVLRAHLAAHPPAPPLPPLPAVVLGPGEVELTDDLVTAPGQPLQLQPGTRLRLRRDVGIYCRGPVTVAGTAEQPVVVRRSGWEAWGAFAITGPATAGSRIAHLDVEGGAGGRLGFQSFPAGLCIHLCPDVELDHCRFGPQARGVDTLHLTRTTARFRRCRFEDARGDGLDLAFADGSLTDCELVGAERNAIDLDESVARLERCSVDGGLRSAVSAGEGSRAEILESLVQRSDLGLDCHDGARVLVRASRFQKNRIAVLCERRGWRYARGGAAALDDVRFLLSRECDLAANARGRILAHRCEQARSRRGGDRIRDVESVPADWLSTGRTTE